MSLNSIKTFRYPVISKNRDFRSAQIHADAAVYLGSAWLPESPVDDVKHEGCDSNIWSLYP